MGTSKLDVITIYATCVRQVMDAWNIGMAGIAERHDASRLSLRLSHGSPSTSAKATADKQVRPPGTTFHHTIHKDCLSPYHSD